ncbi:hypothetical protein GMI69_02365 [Eggerthellaceae bacterium zg-887]|uniref:hypothetical protein n=1 Tax=Xiamenia xianingshaonis TaxID=2682776 RepID=UPI001407ACBD|nr:hypothetical protein [Xiamenia xianingshaonis]NHM15517.1 hypothetical protein [Xiamenia xianingshaonis]
MRNFLDRLGYKLSELMYGRYGVDAFTSFLVVVALAVMFVEILVPSGFLSLASLALLVYAFWRTCSKNASGRAAENRRYEELVRKPKAQVNLMYKRWKNRKTTVYFKCKGCGQVLSVPKGKGTLRVVCPKCRTEVRKKS